MCVCVCYGVANNCLSGSGVQHRDPSVLRVMVDAVADDCAQLKGEGGEAEAGNST